MRSTQEALQLLLQLYRIHILHHLRVGKILISHRGDDDSRRREPISVKGRLHIARILNRNPRLLHLEAATVEAIARVV
jgi:hypothetical protein